MAKKTSAPSADALIERFSDGQNRPCFQIYFHVDHGSVDCVVFNAEREDHYVRFIPVQISGQTGIPCYTLRQALLEIGIK